MQKRGRQQPPSLRRLTLGAYVRKKTKKGSRTPRGALSIVYHEIPNICTRQNGEFFRFCLCISSNRARSAHRGGVVRRSGAARDDPRREKSEANRPITGDGRRRAARARAEGDGEHLRPQTAGRVRPERADRLHQTVLWRQTPREKSGLRQRPSLVSM